MKSYRIIVVTWVLLFTLSGLSIAHVNQFKTDNSAYIFDNARQPAFPGAEGFGRYAQGGRNGDYRLPN